MRCWAGGRQACMPRGYQATAAADRCSTCLRQALSRAGVHLPLQTRTGACRRLRG